MAFEHNDIATKSGLRAGLGETSMGFEHNDIVTTDVMNAAIAAGGGGGGETITWLIDNVTATVAYNAGHETYGAEFSLPDSITAENILSTFSGKNCVTIVNGIKVEAPGYQEEGSTTVQVYFQDYYGGYGVTSFYFSAADITAFIYASADNVGETCTFSLGIVEE